MGMQDHLIGRLAPSPTGSLHAGNIRTFLWAWLSVRSRGGRVILRVEDLEKKAAPGVLEEMLSDLVWLGFDWDEGPVWTDREEEEFRKGAVVTIAENGTHVPYVQSLRGDYYRGIFRTLKTSGLIYPCICSRKEILAAQTAPHEGDQGPKYPGTCRDRFATYEEALSACSEGRKPVWRFRVSRDVVFFEDRCFGGQSVDVAESFGDFIAFKDPGQPSYQTAVVSDDIAMGVTEVVRGDDLIPSTGCQILLYKALGKDPPAYGHVPLVVGEDGTRLAKRHGDFRISALRRGGVTPGWILGRLARWSGLSAGEECTCGELVARWDWGALSKSRVILGQGWSVRGF